MLYRRLFFPLLRHIDPETTHEAALRALEVAQASAAGRRLLRSVAGRLPDGPVQAFGLTFPNVLGLAAGFDKDGRAPLGLALLGFGHVEVGTVTPRPQSGNPRPRIFRLPEAEALINRMGFPNQGVDALATRLGRPGVRDRSWVLGLSMGKQKETPLPEAARDYLAVMARGYAVADYLAVNVSSPNTPGLRELQRPDQLDEMLRLLQKRSEDLAHELGIQRRPLLVKLSPDLEWSQVEDILAIVERHGIAGLVATNTTVSRSGVSGPVAAEAGGLSGRPLAGRSTEMVAFIRQTGCKLPIIAAGGVFTAEDARRKLDAGATLVQVYTGLVYEGPGMAGRLLRALA